MEANIGTVPELLGAALALGAREVPGWSAAERRMVARAEPPAKPERLRELIQAGADPLGTAFCALHTPELRRPLGQTYTPEPVVEAMVAWANARAVPARVVDPGVGSARYLVTAGRRWPSTELLGVEVDPLSAILARGHLAAAGFADRSRVRLTDYRKLRLPKIDGRTLFLGNPPYVRHHQIPAEWKDWLLERARARGLPASALAGLHVHFFLATAGLGRPGDYGALLTSAEWLDVNYGRLVRRLLLDGLGGQAVHVLDPTIEVFPDATTTAAITCFEHGTRAPSLRGKRVRRIRDLGSLDGGRRIARERLAEAPRWSPLIRGAKKLPEDYTELGELCKVHRGQVTGDNDTWIMPRGTAPLPERFLFPTVTRARELFEAGDRLTDDRALRLVADLPAELEELSAADRALVDAFIDEAKNRGAHEGYIASRRRAWWSVGLRAPAPILASYMARRPPAFVRNEVGARHINIAHGLYPRVPLSAGALDHLVRHLRVSVNTGQGRTYAGGLTKFEPREMERLPVPRPEVLHADAATAAPALD